MTKSGHQGSAPSRTSDLFVANSSISGWKLLEVVRLFAASSLSREVSPRLDLPPIQRSAVWAPEKVLNLWDSVLRGFPIGVFYLVPASGHRLVRTVPMPRDQDRTGHEQNGSTRSTTFDTDKAGYELLDGQQRLRAMLAGLVEATEDRRCVWIDLGKLGDRLPDGRPAWLMLSSRAQPFGYDRSTGRKLGLDARREARKRIEPVKQEPLKYRAMTECTERAAYDSDLFDGPVYQINGKRIQQPPAPFEGTKGLTYPLWQLFAAWEAGQLSAFHGVTPEREGMLGKAFSQLKHAEVSLIRVPTCFDDEKRDLLDLFKRIGAGGVPLTEEERLYSTYKHYSPRVHDAVLAVQERAGRILPAVKIAMTALRIANVLANPARSDVPGEAEFMQEMARHHDAGPEERTGSLAAKLEALLPSAGTGAARAGVLASAFEGLTSLLRRPSGTERDRSAGPFWVPDVMSAALPTELWQTLAFWAVKNGETERSDASREDLVRFVLFWQACVFNPKKAAARAIRRLGSTEGSGQGFPGTLLYHALTDELEGSYAHKLPSPAKFAQLLVAECESPIWRSEDDRFGPTNGRDEFAASWWRRGGGGERLLPWLQRDYIWAAFQGFAPLTDHEDDLPYDVDHLCPVNEWGADWRTVARRVACTDDAVKAMWHQRDHLGNSLGNLQLVASSVNRHLQDEDVGKKMPEQADGDQEDRDGIAEGLAEWAFPTDAIRNAWRRVSRNGGVEARRWDEDRLAAFQHGIELRVAWLYEQFHHDLRFERWTDNVSANDGVRR